MLSNNPHIYLIEREKPFIIFCQAAQAIYDNGNSTIQVTWSYKVLMSYVYIERYWNIIFV